MAELSKLNFNLLKSLNVLLRHKSVSKAASELCITAPAMSLHLKQLREILVDELLVRGQSGQMYLTGKAAQLIPQVIAAINSLSAVFIPNKKTDHFSFEGEFAIGMSQDSASIVVPPLVEIIREKMPKLKLVVKNIIEITSPNIFSNRTIDIALHFFDNDLSHVYKRKLFSNEGMIVAHPKHSIWQQFTGFVESILDCDFIVYTEKASLFDHPRLVHSLRKLDKSVRINAIVSDPFVAIKTAAYNKAITFVSKQFATPLLKKYNLIAKPLLKPKFPDTSIYWHEITENDPVCIWIRNELLWLFTDKFTK